MVVSQQRQGQSVSPSTAVPAPSSTDEKADVGGSVDGAPAATKEAADCDGDTAGGGGASSVSDALADILRPPPGPPPLPLSQTDDGALATAPLTTVINAATDALYQDLYNLVHAEIGIAQPSAAAQAKQDVQQDGGEAGGADGTFGASSAGGTGGNAAASVEEKLTAAALLGGDAPGGDATGVGVAGDPPALAAAVLETRKERMANLSFAQRRHELTHRIVRHTKSLSHAWALSAACMPKGRSVLYKKPGRDGGGSGDTPLPPRLGATVQTSSDALRHVRSGWMAADEAQDALYFHHDGLWKARAHCHDVLGAICVISTPDGGGEGDGGRSDAVGAMEIDGDDDDVAVKKESASTSVNANELGVSGGRWPDFPTDVALAVDRYDISRERSHSLIELRARLACAVRRKLVVGEVGAFGIAADGDAEAETTPDGQANGAIVVAGTVIGVVGAESPQRRARGDRSDEGPIPWRVALERGGGAVRLTHGKPRLMSTAEALRQSSLADHVSGDGSSAEGGRTAMDGTAASSPSLRTYPMEVRLSVLSEHPAAPWKLLSVHVRLSPKTGESDHQLVMNRKQMFDLHRIADRAMTVEEAICRKANQDSGGVPETGEEGEDADAETKANDDNGGEMAAAVTATAVDASEENDQNKEASKPSLVSATSSPLVPRPLHRLFEVTHAFALSMQLEMLSSQAEALRRGAWGGYGDSASGRGGSDVVKKEGDGIAVSPAYFFDQQNGAGDEEESGTQKKSIGVMAVHFWSGDSRYGSPEVGDLSASLEKETGANDSKRDDESSAVPSKLTHLGRTDDNHLPKSDRRGDNRLSLCIRAVPLVGLVVSLSGGSEVVSSLHRANESAGESEVGASSCSTTAHGHHLQRNVDKLLTSIQDPFQLSISDALLAATVLCAERRCEAMIAALARQRANKPPSWIHLSVECGSISVAARISYHRGDDDDEPSPGGGGGGGGGEDSPKNPRPPSVLFRLACDSRTGRFIPVFPRPASLLRLLACNDPSASDVQAVRSAAAASSSVRAARPDSRGSSNASARKTDGASREATGRVVRDAFDALARSVDVLGRRCGVGGDWNDVDAQSAALRERSIDQACRDVRSSLMTCSAIAAVYGVSAMALRIAGGVDPLADMAGGPINDKQTNGDIIHIPPLSVPLRQRIIEKVVDGGDEPKLISLLEGELLAVTAKTSEDSMSLVCYDVLTSAESASSVPARVKFVQANPESKSHEYAKNNVDGDSRPLKRPRNADSESNESICHHTLDEVEYAALWFDSMLRQ